MIKKLFFLLAIMGLAAPLFAQPGKVIPPPLPARDISGVVLDSAEQPLRGAIVSLTSKTDSLKVRTNEDGIFFFSNVKSAEFTLSVSILGYPDYVKLGKYNDSKPRLTMDRIIIGKAPRVLQEVVINGTPSITYKTDTVEYRASDYIVREGSGVDELLKKMEGMEVGKDGSLTYNGALVDKARLNGKDFLGGKGNVATVTRLLPAEIVEKIQIVDDYGDQAVLSGIKTGDPEKLLNITTKADRSIGYIARMNGGAGNNNRYDGNLTGLRINANKNVTLSGAINNTINGVSTNSTGGVSGLIPAAPGAVRPAAPGGALIGGGAPVSGGNTRRQTAAFSYSDQLSKKTTVNMNYSYSITDVNSINDSFAQNFSDSTTLFTRNDNNSDNNSKNHNFSMTFINRLDSANSLQISPTFSYASTLSNTASSSFLSGLIHQDQIVTNSGLSKAPNFGLTALYSHVFFPTEKRKNRKNMTLQLSAASRNSAQDKEQISNLTYYKQLTDIKLKDSLAHRSIERDNQVKNYRASLTYTINSSLNFSGEVNYNDYDNKAITNSISAGGSSVIDSLSNIFAYSFTQAKLTLSYHRKMRKSDLTIGASTLPTALSGTNTSLGTSVQRSSLNIVPVMRYSYSWTPQRSASINYSGTITEPQFEQLQPLKDVSNPQYPVFGNPDLKAALNHSLSAAYSTYSPNTRFGITAGLNTTFYMNRVITNIIQVSEAYNSLRFEKHFLNINGTYQAGGNYTVSKQAADRKYSLSLTGNVNYLHNAGMSNNLRNISSQWAFMQKLSPKLNPGKNFEFNPSVTYIYAKVNNSLPKAQDSKTNVWSFQVDGRIYFLKSWLMGYSASKNLVHGINSNITNNALIVNPYLEKQFLKRKTIRLRIQAFDLFNQNKLINRDITELSITDTRSNALSRYIMVNLSASLQYFKGTPKRNGEILKRQGDGSFIY